MKKYITPSIKVEEFYTTDIIAASGDVTPRFVKEGTSTNAGSGTTNWNPLWD